MPENAFVGIDVAFAKKKRLPICVCVIRNNSLYPLDLKDKSNLPIYPRGKGNKLAIDPSIVENFSQETLAYICAIEKKFNIKIVRIAIDAPSAFRRTEVKRREAEQAMDRLGISCFATPSKEDFNNVIEKIEKHLGSGGSESTLPHANQLWMLAGFSLFERLRKKYECIEVFPQAIVAALGCSKVHKSKKDGLAAQEQAAWIATGWAGKYDNPDLKSAVYGSPHDRLDAYLSAWIASLPEEKRTCYGNKQNDDVIWTQKAIR